jgi:hypothetical protein
VDIKITESFASAPQRVICKYCGNKVLYFDKLDNGKISCLVCSYKKGFAPAENCSFNPRIFDPSDPDQAEAMVKICQHDIDTADKDICTSTIIIPEDLHKPLQEVRKLHGESSFNAELVCALGWYLQLCVVRQDQMKLQLAEDELSVVDADMPDLEKPVN